MASESEIYEDNQALASNEIDISRQGDFNYFVTDSTMYLLDLKDDKINCYRAEKKANHLDFVKYKDHMKVLRKYIFGSPEKKTKNHSFADVIHQFQTTQPKKKLYCRHECFYLVKKSFTEGVQYVKQGEIHIYKAIGKPLDIFVSNQPLELKSFRSSYELHMKPERILPGESKTIHSNTYYIVIAPCHTFFKKEKTDSLEMERSIELRRLPAIGALDHQNATVEENNGVLPSSERINQPELLPIFDKMSSFSRPSGSRPNDALPSSERASQTELLPRFDKQSTFSQPSELRNDVHINSNLSMESARASEPEIANGSGNRGTTRTSESDRQSKRVKSSTPLPRVISQMNEDFVPQSPNSLRNEIALMHSLNGTNVDSHRRAIFAIRKDSNIESYALRSGSTFQVLPDSIMTGSFAIENEDMDPYVIEYHGEVQHIREMAKFKNGSTFETTITVQKDLLNELQDPVKKKEKIIVNHFFDVAFKAIEAAYKKFCEMRNTKMIGSCVPAIVSLSDAKFNGPLSDVYEAKP